MERYSKEAVFDKLKKYCYFSNNDDDYIEVTKWHNGEGIDISICRGDRDPMNISLTFGELDAINYLKNILEFGDAKC